MGFQWGDEKFEEEIFFRESPYGDLGFKFELVGQKTMIVLNEKMTGGKVPNFGEPINKSKYNNKVL